MFERRTIDVLLMIRLLFTMPVSNAKLERMFSKLKRVKTNFYCSLDVKRLENILRITEEGGSWETFDPISAIKKRALIKLGAQYTAYADDTTFFFFS